MPPIAATIGTTAVAGRRSSPATISRLSSRPTTKKKIASSPSEAHAPRVSWRCSAAGPTVTDRRLWYASRPGEFAHPSAASAPISKSAPPAFSVRSVSARFSSDPAERRSKRRAARRRTIRDLPGRRRWTPTSLPGTPVVSVPGAVRSALGVQRKSAVHGARALVVGLRPPLLRRVEPVADVAHGADELLVLGTELGAQPAHVDIDGASAPVVVVAPDFLQQLRASEHPTGVLNEVLDQLELFVREIERATTESRRVPTRVDVQVARCDLGRLRAERAARRVLHRQADPSLDLRWSSGVEQDVVRAPLARDDDQPTLGEHQDERDVETRGAQQSTGCARHRQVTARVEQDEVRVGCVHQRGGFHGKHADAVRQQPEGRQDLRRAAGGWSQQQQICDGVHLLAWALTLYLAPLRFRRLLDLRD